jgi:protein-disulfide isomerase
MRIMDEHMHKKDNEGMYAVAIAVIISAIILSGMMFYAANSVNSNLQLINTNLGNLKINVNVPAGSNTGQLASATPTPQPTAAPAAIDMKALASNDPAIGPVDAKVTVIEFTDFECVFCGAAAGTHTELIARFKASDPTWEAAEPKLVELAKAGKIRLVVRDFPLTNIHPNAQKSAEAAECANQQGKFWEMHDKLFKSQTALAVTDLKKYAAELKLDTAKFNDCLDNGKATAEVQADQADGLKVGVGGTPAFFVNGEFIEGAQSFSAFQTILTKYGV